MYFCYQKKTNLASWAFTLKENTAGSDDDNEGEDTDEDKDGDEGKYDVKGEHHMEGCKLNTEKEII